MMAKEHFIEAYGRSGTRFPFLPWRLREPVALAYLLARATDTVADTARIPGLCGGDFANVVEHDSRQSSARCIGSLAAASSPFGSPIHLA